MTRSTEETVPHSEVALLFPRRQVHQGRGRGGRVVPKDRPGPARCPRPVRRLARRSVSGRAGGTIRTCGHGRGFARHGGRRSARPPQPVRGSVLGTGLRQPAGWIRSEIDLHFVNYNRAELPPGPDGQPNLGAGIKDEKPLAVSGVVADVVLPEGATLRSVRFLTPEQEGEQTLEANSRGRPCPVHSPGVSRLWRGSDRISEGQKLRGAMKTRPRPVDRPAEPPHLNCSAVTAAVPALENNGQTSQIKEATEPSRKD